MVRACIAMEITIEPTLLKPPPPPPSKGGGFNPNPPPPLKRGGGLYSMARLSIFRQIQTDSDRFIHFCIFCKLIHSFKEYNDGQTKDKRRTPADTRRTYEGHTKDSQGTKNSFIQGHTCGHTCGHTEDTLRTRRTYCGHTADTKDILRTYQ